MKLEITDLLDKIVHLCGVAQSNRVQNPGLVAQQHTNILELITKFRTALTAAGSRHADSFEVSIDELAGDTHEQWLASAGIADRSSSPFNAHWRSLTEDQRAQISRQAANVAVGIQRHAPDGMVIIKDEYAAWFNGGPKADPPTDAENADAGEVAHSEVERDSSGAPVDLTDADKLTPAGVDPAPSSGD